MIKFMKKTRFVTRVGFKFLCSVVILKNGRLEGFWTYFSLGLECSHVLYIFENDKEKTNFDKLQFKKKSFSSHVDNQSLNYEFCRDLVTLFTFLYDKYK